MSPFLRGRTQVLYRYLPGALFVHDQFGICTVTITELEPLPDLNARALIDALGDYLAHWDADLRPGFVLEARSGDPSRFYTIGAPRRVRFAPYPELLMCVGCGRVATLAQLRTTAADGQCPACGQRFQQVRFVEAHPCGRIAPLVVATCPTHGSAHVRLETHGRFRTLAWRCLACGDRFLEGTRNRACGCACSKRLPKDSRERRLRGMVVTDPGLHLIHTLPLINIPPAQIDPVLADPDGRTLALARSCGVLSDSVLTTMQQRALAQGQATQPMLAAFLAQLHSSGLDEAFIQAQLELAQPPTSAAEQALASLAHAFGVELEHLRGIVPRRVVEYALLLDSAGARDLAVVRGQLLMVGDTEGADALEAGRVLAAQLGLLQLSVLDAFPLALCAIGYSRLTRAPQQCMVVPFARLPGDARIPLYMLSTTTEGIAFQLDPARVLAWLTANGIVTTPIPPTPLDAWAQLYRFAPGLLHGRFQPGYQERATVLVRTLLHSVSHALLHTIAWSGYDPQSVAEFLFPETLGGVLYANRYQDTKIGGLVTLFERGLAAWLQQARDEARNCLYDPLCADEGGACVGCLHREYGCTQLNGELSRAVLFGGPLVLDGQPAAVIEIASGYWEPSSAIMEPHSS
jgi:hypothetical protein